MLNLKVQGIYNTSFTKIHDRSAKEMNPSRDLRSENIWPAVFNSQEMFNMLNLHTLPLSCLPLPDKTSCQNHCPRIRGRLPLSF